MKFRNLTQKKYKNGKKKKTKIKINILMLKRIKQKSTQNSLCLFDNYFEKQL